MKFVISSKQLLDKLQKLAKVVNPKSTLVILGCFLFEVKGSKLYLVASDTENRMAASLDIESAEGEGKIAIDAPTILNALKELPDQPITIDINDSNLEVFIYYHNGKFNFIGNNGEDFPESRPLDEKVKVKLVVPTVDLQNILIKTRFACADDELRPVMNGIYFDIDTSNTTFVASDGHKLVRLISSIKGESKGSFILPKKGVDIVKDLVSRETEDVIINYDLNNAIFKIGDYSLTVRFIEGRYPNYNSVIPINQPNKFSINKNILLSIVKRVSVLSNKTSNLIAFDVTSEKLTVSSQDIDFSTAAEESTEISFFGTPTKLGLKATFLIETLNSTNSEEVELSFSDPSRAILITPSIENVAFNQTNLLIPMMLND